MYRRKNVPPLFRKTVRLSSYHALKPTDVCTVIDLYGTFVGKSRAKLLPEISQFKISVSGMSRRQSFDTGFLTDLENAVGQLPKHQKAAIDTFVAGATGLAAPSLEETIHRWIDSREIDSQGFAERCANDKGHYLVLRLPSSKQLMIAYMRITFDPAQDILPHFETSTFDNGSQERLVQGQIIYHGDHAYTLGKVHGTKEIRVSKLGLNTLLTEQTDLYGIRLGKSANINRPYGHLVYGLQLIENSPDDVLAELKSETGLTEKKLAKRVPDLKKIKDLLKPQKVAELGLITNSNFGY